jgi:hypothetical protein
VCLLLAHVFWRFFVSCTISEFPPFSPTDDIDESHVEDVDSPTATPVPMEEEAELRAIMSTWDMGQPMEDGPWGLPTNALGLAPLSPFSLDGATNAPGLPTLDLTLPMLDDPLVLPAYAAGLPSPPSYLGMSVTVHQISCKANACPKTVIAIGVKAI